MKVLLINPNVGYYTRALFNPLGLLSIGSFLKTAGHEVMLYDRCVDKTKFQTILDSFDPEFIGISVMSSRGLKDAIKISKPAKKSGKTVVWGGQLPSMQTELVLAEDYVDMVSVGATINDMLCACLATGTTVTFDTDGMFAIGCILNSSVSATMEQAIAAANASFTATLAVDFCGTEMEAEITQKSFDEYEIQMISPEIMSPLKIAFYLISMFSYHVLIRRAVFPPNPAWISPPTQWRRWTPQPW